MPTIILDQLVEKWRIKRLLAQGGQGVVYEAVSEGIDQRGALKVLLALHATPALVHRFTNEGRAVNAIRHPNIPQVFDYGLFPDGVPWMVMEYLDGESLEARLLRERLSLVEALAIADDVASAIAAAHQKNIIHRDLKYSNVMLVPDDTKILGVRAMVLDFGIAKLIEAEGVTGTGNLVGTPVFMAYEQIERPKEVDGKADVYSLGVMLFQMLCRRLPFPYKKDDSTLLILTRKADPPTPIEKYAPELPDELRALVNAMVQKDRTKRPTMAEVRLVLRRVQGLPPPQTGRFDALRALPEPIKLAAGTLDLQEDEVDEVAEAPTADAPPSLIEPVPPAPTPSEQKVRGEVSPHPLPVPLSISDTRTAKVHAPLLRAGPEESTARPAPTTHIVEAIASPSAEAVAIDAQSAAPAPPPAPSRWRVIPPIAGALLLSASLTAWIIHSPKPQPSPISPRPASTARDIAEVPHPAALPSPDMAASADLAHTTVPRAKNEPHSRGKDRSSTSGCSIPKLVCVTGHGTEEQLRRSIVEAFSEAKIELCSGERVLLELEQGSREAVFVDTPSRWDKDDRKLIGAALRSRLPAPDRRITVEVRCKR